MGRKQKKDKIYASASTFRISKKKSVLGNLNMYIQHLKSKQAHMSSKEYINQIHQFIAKLAKQKGALSPHLIQKTKNMFKICRVCDKWALHSKKMVQCNLCEDHFHLDCVSDYDGSHEWRCQACCDVEKRRKVLQKQLQVRNRPPACEKCLQNKIQSSIKCLKCSKYFHKSCFGKQVVVCGDCNEEIEAKLRGVQKQLTLNESFKKAERHSSIRKKMRLSEQITRTSTVKMEPKQGKQIQTQDVETQKIPQKLFKKQKQQRLVKVQRILKEKDQTTKPFLMLSNAKRFKSKFPAMTETEISNYKKDLQFAILSKNLQYIQDLYCRNCQLFEDKEDSIDFSLEHMGHDDLRFFQAYKKQPIGPFRLQYRKECGYDVVADKDLPQGMIVCEYVGDVYKHRDALELPENDSVMELKTGKNADETLYIVPTHFTNIARFLNSVNNQERNTRKQNVTNVLTYIQGRPAVVLYTVRQIQKGESLLYDYGAGNADIKYDTSHYC